jgi:hypothetical protein
LASEPSARRQFGGATDWEVGQTTPFLVHRLTYNSDGVAFKMGRRQGGPSRTGGRRAHPAPV